MRSRGSAIASAGGYTTAARRGYSATVGDRHTPGARLVYRTPHARSYEAFSQVPSEVQAGAPAQGSADQGAQEGGAQARPRAEQGASQEPRQEEVVTPPRRSTRRSAAGPRSRRAGPTHGSRARVRRTDRARPTD